MAAHLHRAVAGIGDHLAAWNFFQSAESEANEAFVARWKELIGEARVTNDPMEAHYIGFNMWVNAATAAGSTDVDAVAGSGLERAQDVLQAWQAKDMWQREADGLFFRAEKIGATTYRLYDFDTGEAAGAAEKSALAQIKPNSGVRALIATALVRFQLSDPDPARRFEALTSIERDPNADALAPLRASIGAEPDPALKTRKRRLERLLTIAFDGDQAARVAAIGEMSGDLGRDARATLNPLVATELRVFAGAVPVGLNVARVLEPGSTELPLADAYDLLVAGSLAPARARPDEVRAALAANIVEGRVGGVPLARLSTDAGRAEAYAALADAGKVPPPVTAAAVDETVAAHVFAEIHAEPSAAVTGAARAALDRIATRVGVNRSVDLALDALSLASIYYLAAIRLAITFGVMGVINMAHGEFIMMGAYTGFVVQQVIPNHTASILVAIPLAFAVTFAAWVALERLVIRWRYNRPPETLLATFGISIALQQLAKNVFGTQARPLTAPAWLDGAWTVNDVISISYIRIAIFFLALIFLALLLYIMKRTRLELETRAVTRNRRMAASAGINSNRVNMLTFGLGSGIAGIAGVAIGLFAKVTSELGSDYIVQSFMTVVVGGVGNIWGTPAGATMIGFLQKGIEWLNPSNRLAAQTDTIDFIILFIQARPRGGGVRRMTETVLAPSSGRKYSGGLGAEPPTYRRRQPAKSMPLPGCDRDGSGLGLLRHPVAGALRVLRARWLHDRHVADVRAHPRHRHRGLGRGADRADRGRDRADRLDLPGGLGRDRRARAALRRGDRRGFRQPGIELVHRRAGARPAPRRFHRQVGRLVAGGAGALVRAGHALCAQGHRRAGRSLGRTASARAPRRRSRPRSGRAARAGGGGMTTLLEVSGVSVSLDGYKAINNLSFQIGEAELRAIIGPNGAGKTTFIDIVTGKTRPDEGRIVWGDKSRSLLAMSEARIAREGIGRKFQKPTVFEDQSVRDNLLMVLKKDRGPFAVLFYRPTAADMARVEELAEEIGLRTQLDRKSGELSHGQQQQLAIARALVMRPKLLLLDEPTEGIQPNVIKQIGEVIRHLRDRREMAIVLVEQFFEFAHDLADRFVALRRGQVSLAGDRASVTKAELLEGVTVWRGQGQRAGIAPAVPFRPRPAHCGRIA